MSRTRRRHSYRRSKRWNPGARPNENEIPTVRIVRRRNPADFVRYLGDGSKVEVSSHGHVTVSDSGGVFSEYRIGRDRLAHFIRDLQKPARNSNKYDYHEDSVRGEGAYSVHNNPRRGRGHRKGKRQMQRRKDRRHFRDSRRGLSRRARFEGSAAWGEAKFRERRIGRRRNWVLKNPYISPREAKAMARVLRRHGRRCSGKRRSRGRRHR